MQENICHFIPYHKDIHSIHPINFVFETTTQTYSRLKLESVYKIYYVCSGTGIIHTPGKTTHLSKDDIFFSFPGYPFAIESKDDFSYMYISFVGLRANMIFENLQISNTNFVFHNANEVYDFWKKGLSSNENVIDMMSESILLYTFSFLSDMLIKEKEDHKSSYRSINLIKKYIDDHFTEHNFSLDNISQELSYNKKYISYIFKKKLGVGIIEYLNTIRIQNACTMIEQNFTSVNDIADQCGFADAQYFSHIFKKQTGLTPTQYMKSSQINKKSDSPF